MKKFVVAAAFMVLLSPAAWAGAYVGASFGQSDAEAMGIQGDDTSWKLMGGYTFMKFVAVEGSYRNIGGLDETVLTTTVELDATSMDVFGVGILPIGEKFELFAKAGWARIEGDITVSDSADPLDPFLNFSASDNETEMVYGAGFNFKIGEKIALRVEHESFDATDELTMTSVGGVFRF